MRLLNCDRSEGYAKIEVENQDDLWYLSRVFRPPQRVRKRTQRTVLEGREKKSCVLTIEVEKTELQSDRLRLTGEIIEGAEDIELGYHSFNIEPDENLEVWGLISHDWDLLDEAESSENYEVLFCLIQSGKADFYRVKESGIEDLSSVNENIPGKMYDDQESPSFLKDVKAVIERTRNDYDAVILAGPGFEKKSLYDLFDDNEGLFTQDTSVVGLTGLNEAIKRGALKKVVEESRIDEESAIMEEFFNMMKTDGPVSYGEPVEDLVKQGAVEKLIVTPEIYREERELIENTGHTGGEVRVVHTDHEAGERLDKIGGIAAFLRYKPV